MNNKLIADIENNRKRKDLLHKVVPELERLVKNSGTFSKQESIGALNEIRNRLTMLQDELKNSYVINKKMRRELDECCTHEALIKRGNYYECAICGKCFNINDINFNAFLVECLESRPILFIIVSNVISDIAMKEEVFFEVFEDKLYKKYKEYDDIDNLLVYRRSR